MAQRLVASKYMKLKPSKSAAVNARALLPELLANYFKAGRKAAEGKPSLKKLHGFRLATKQFRYSLELFRPLYGAGLDKKLTALSGLQGVLGKMSDYRSVRTLLAGDKALEAKIDRATKKQLKAFHEQWAAFDSGGQFKRWRVYLEKGGA
jgi:CHAD domain-containing protein